MEEIDLHTLHRLASIRTWEEEQRQRGMVFCPDCGAPIAAGIVALHRHCPAHERAPMTALSRSHPRKRGPRRYV